MAASQTRRVFDSHLHAWSGGAPPFAWVSKPPDELKNAATHENLQKLGVEAGVSNALIVQPANHMFDHSYLDSALAGAGASQGPAVERGRGDPAPPPALGFQGMCLANPTLGTARASVQDLEQLHARGYRGVRFNPALFPKDAAAFVHSDDAPPPASAVGSAEALGPLYSNVARALFRRAGELKMPVGVMAFTGLHPHIKALRALLAESPQTVLVVDHFGFFRQPATGGVIEPAAGGPAGGGGELPPWLSDLRRSRGRIAEFEREAGSSRYVAQHLASALSTSGPARAAQGPPGASNDEDTFEALLWLGEDFPAQVYVKLSALFRVSKEPFPHLDLRPRVLALLDKLGAGRLMWGSDFPFVLLGGQTRTPSATEYAESVTVFDRWNAEQEREFPQTPPPERPFAIDEEDVQQIMAGTAERLFGLADA